MRQRPVWSFSVAFTRYKTRSGRSKWTEKQSTQLSAMVQTNCRGGADGAGSSTTYFPVEPALSPLLVLWRPAGLVAWLAKVARKEVNPTNGFPSSFPSVERVQLHFRSSTRQHKITFAQYFRVPRRHRPSAIADPTTIPSLCALEGATDFSTPRRTGGAKPTCALRWIALLTFGVA